MPGESDTKQPSKIRKFPFNSWEYPDEDDKVTHLIKNLERNGRPIVNRGGVPSLILCDRLGYRPQLLGKDNLLAEFVHTTRYLVMRESVVYDKDNNVVPDPKTGKPARKLQETIGQIPRRLVDLAYGYAHNLLWELRGTLTHPVVNRDGEIVMLNGLYQQDIEIKGMSMQKPVIHLYDGYDPVTQCFFALPKQVQLRLAGIATLKPTGAQVSDALYILGTFLGDFTFASKSAYASAIAFMLTVLCRDIIKRSVPMLEVRAPESQSGKTLLVKMMIMAITGEKAHLFSPAFSHVEEFEKELFSILLQGRNYVFMDNVYGKVRSSFLDTALTSDYVSKRVLGVNAVATVYSGMPFVMTANNPSLSEDMRNRVYLLDILKPRANKQYVHHDPEEYALAAGPDILWALFVLYRNWKVAGEPFYTERRMDGFIEWSGKIGGILAAAGIEGFLEDTLLQMNETEPWKEQAATMAKYWYEGYTDKAEERHAGHGSNWLFVKDTFEYALLAGYVKDGDTFASKLSTIGNQLKKARMARLPGGYRFERNPDEKHGSQWRVVKDGGKN